MSPPDGGTGSKFVLVVDDDPDIRDIVKLLLEAQGYRVVAASDGQDAWDLLERGHSPALILLDLMMPRMDGDHFLRRVHDRIGQGPPVVIMSGATTSSEVATKYGATGSLAKPVDLDDLLLLVRNHVGPTAPA